jgi:dTDP-4-dehydrorhamnose reductase
MTLLVAGASGYLGREVCRRAVATGWLVAGMFLSAPGPVEGVRWHRVDLRDGAAVAELVRWVRPTAVVNAAYRYDDWSVNADGAAQLARAAARAGARLVHVSTDALHAGRPEPYPDDAAPSPVHPYGAAKAAAETAVRAIDPGAAIVRTSLIVGDEHSQQIRLCLDLITGRASGVLFEDEVRCPVAVEDLAGAVLELVGTDYAGLLNVAGPDAVNRAELGELVARRYGLDPASVPTGTAAAMGLRRPGEVRLDVSLAARTLTTRLRGFRELLGGVIEPA